MLDLYSSTYQLQPFQSKIVKNLAIPSRNLLTASRRCDTREKQMKKHTTNVGNKFLYSLPSLLMANKEVTQITSLPVLPEN